MKKSYRTLEFSFIQDYIKNYCFSEMAKKRIDQIKPFQDIDDLKLYQDDISSAMKIIYAYGRIPLAPYEDIKEILQKAQKGGVCYPQDLLKIVQILKNVQEVQAYLDQEIEQSHLLEILSLLYLPKDLYNEILKCVDPSGNIYDHASHELYRLRRQISAIEANMRKKIEALRAQHKDYLSHDVISTRNDHFVLPVNVSYKNQIKGIHHGHSSSGRTTYVEPEEIVSYNNQLSQIKQDEQLEIHRILLELTKKVRSYDRVLNEDLEIMIEMDAVFAISEYGKKLDMVMPVVDENCQEIELLKARHPLIDQKEVVANDIVLKKPQDILLISGSNTGGKTVALKTAGLLSLMAICGFPIPVTQAKLPLFDDVFVDVGDEQSIEQSLSTFSSHMKRLVFITQHATKNSLVIIDEICSGTDPKEGESLAEAILTYLHKKGAYILASTHYSALKEFAKESDYIKIASVEFDQEKMQPTYRLLDGSVGNSYAIEISKHLGLNQDIIQHAFIIKDESMTTSQKLLEKLQSELSAVLQEKEALEKELEDLRQNRLNYDHKAEVLNSEIRAVTGANQLVKKQIAAFKEEVTSLREQAKSSKETIAKLTEERLQTEQHCAQLRTQEREKSVERENLGRELARLEERKANLQKEYDSIITKLWEEYELTRREAQALDIQMEDAGKAQRRLNELKSKIKALGTVNVAAIEEYQEVSERYEFLTSQIADVEKSRNELRKLIHDLIHQMKELFLERFEQINTNFKETFQTLFGGGKANLELLDSDNVLESGIGITVHPPGKIVTNIELLSGGEKALVAIALYFAIMKVSPPPFCILDEIEAALDDVNVSRFASYLRKMNDNTQFVTITHRRGTMEEADVLYGVTMQDQGVSKLLELDVSEIEEKLGL